MQVGLDKQASKQDSARGTKKPPQLSRLTVSYLCQGSRKEMQSN